MKESYSFRKTEEKWKRRWEKERCFEVDNNSDKEKFYCLVEFPYPSGEGLHVGHPRSYTAMDVVARKKRMEGFNVLFPIGWDAFGLPAENYAIKTRTHPRIATEKNITRFRKQLKSLGLSFDWSREINTTDPHYYHWTQWIFIQLFKNGLAYKKSMAINWCTSCNVGLANEEVVDGHCERCGGEVIQKEREQWMLKITDYADKLIKGLDTVDYPARVKKQQLDWIGRSEGALITFKISTAKHFNQSKSMTSVEVFTTRPDTLFGATFLVLSPEHPLVKEITTPEYEKEVTNYKKQAQKKTSLERTDLQKEKTGVFTGAYAINPATNEQIPIWTADYIMMDYGTGAIMAVPAHDERDYAFAKRYNLPVREVITSRANEDEAQTNGGNKSYRSVYTGEGTIINSGKFDGMSSKEAQDAITKFVKGDKKVQYKLRDWVFSRQRYWGEPIPLIFCQHCAKEAERLRSQKSKSAQFSKGELLNPGWIAVDEKNLPVELPNINEYRTNKEGDSPLASVKEWVKTTCPKCGGPAKRETDTMPQWAGSSWYYLRYTDPHNDKELAGKKALKYWTPVDWYNGGMEHTTLHLLYSRFWHKFLYDIGVVPTPEPYTRRTSHGLILGKGGEKMSKSRGNVVNPDDMVSEFGADAFRLYEMFMGPFEESIPWSNDGIVGSERFLNRIWRLCERVESDGPSDEEVVRAMHRTIKKVSYDIEHVRFNTAVSALMIALNEMEKATVVAMDVFEPFVLMLSAFAPFMAEELWERLGHNESLSAERWPVYDEQLTELNMTDIAVQINGKTRGVLTMKPGTSQEDVMSAVKKDKKLYGYIENTDIKRVVFVPDKIINYVIAKQ